MEYLKFQISVSVPEKPRIPISVFFDLVKVFDYVDSENHKKKNVKLVDQISQNGRNYRLI